MLMDLVEKDEIGPFPQLAYPSFDSGVIKSGWFYFNIGKNVTKRFALLTLNSLKIKETDHDEKAIKTIRLDEIEKVDSFDDYMMYYSLVVKLKADSAVTFHYLTQGIRKSWLDCLNSLLTRDSSLKKDPISIQKSATDKHEKTGSSQESLFETTRECTSYFYDDFKNELDSSSEKDYEFSYLKQKLTLMNKSYGIMSENLKKSKAKNRYMQERFSEKIKELSSNRENLIINNALLQDRLKKSLHQNHILSTELLNIKNQINHLIPETLNKSQPDIIDALIKIKKEHEAIRDGVASLQLLLDNRDKVDVQEFNAIESLEYCKHRIITVFQNIETESKPLEDSFTRHDSYFAFSCKECFHYLLNVILTTRNCDNKPRDHENSLKAFNFHAIDHVKDILQELYRNFVINQKLANDVVCKEKFIRVLNDKILNNLLHSPDLSENRDLLSRISNETYKVMIQCILFMDESKENCDQGIYLNINSQETCVVEVYITMIGIFRTLLQSYEDNSKFVAYDDLEMLELQTRTEDRKPAKKSPIRSHSFSYNREFSKKSHISYLDKALDKDLNYVVSAMQRCFMDERQRMLSNIAIDCIPKNYFNVYAEESQMKMKQIEARLNEIWIKPNDMRESAIFQEIVLQSIKRIHEKLIAAENISHEEMFRKTPILISDIVLAENSFSELINKNISIVAALLRHTLEDVQFLLTTLESQ